MGVNSRKELTDRLEQSNFDNKWKHLVKILSECNDFVKVNNKFHALKCQLRNMCSVVHWMASTGHLEDFAGTACLGPRPATESQPAKDFECYFLEPKSTVEGDLQNQKVQLQRQFDTLMDKAS